jgi:hypothetical protein
MSLVGTAVRLGHHHELTDLLDANECTVEQVHCGWLIDQLIDQHDAWFQSRPRCSRPWFRRAGLQPEIGGTGWCVPGGPGG